MNCKKLYEIIKQQRRIPVRNSFVWLCCILYDPRLVSCDPANGDRPVWHCRQEVAEFCGYIVQLYVVTSKCYIHQSAVCSDIIFILHKSHWQWRYGKKYSGKNWPYITTTFWHLFHGSCKTAFMPLAACMILQQCRLQLVKLSRPFGLSLLRLFESF